MVDLATPVVTGGNSRCFLKSIFNIKDVFNHTNNNDKSPQFCSKFHVYGSSNHSCFVTKKEEELISVFKNHHIGSQFWMKTTLSNYTWSFKCLAMAFVFCITSCMCMHHLGRNPCVWCIWNPSQGRCGEKKENCRGAISLTGWCGKNANYKKYRTCRLINWKSWSL